MGRNVIQVKTIGGRDYLHGEFKDLMLDRCRVLNFEQPDGFSMREIIDAVHAEAHLDKKLSTDIRNEVSRMVGRGQLVRIDNGMFAAGLAIDKLAEDHERPMAERLRRLVMAEGGWCSFATMKEHVADDETDSLGEYSDGRERFGALENALRNVDGLVRLSRGLYYLDASVRAGLVQEGRHVRLEVLALTNHRMHSVVEDPDGGVPYDDREREMMRATWVGTTNANLIQNARGEIIGMTRDVEDEMVADTYAAVATAFYRWRALVGISMDEIAADELIQRALDRSIFTAERDVDRQLFHQLRADFPDKTARTKHLMEKFEAGQSYPHRVLRTAFYEAVGRKLNVDPVALSYGHLRRSVHDDYNPQKKPLPAGGAKARRQIVASDRQRERRKGIPSYAPAGKGRPISKPM